MFILDDYQSDIECKELSISNEMFHLALQDGEKRYHVKSPKGDYFDIVYLDNNDDIEPIEFYPKYMKGPFMAQYLSYDETDKDTLYIDFFQGINAAEFEEVNEYSIALTRVILSFTQGIDIWFDDPRILWFISEDDRVHVVEKLPELSGETTFYVQKQFKTGLEDRDFNRLSSTYAFHNVFFPQWMLKGKKCTDYKYVTMITNSMLGIGALLAFQKRFEIVFSHFGLKLITNEERLGKYRVEMLNKYFAFELTAEDASGDNTLVIDNQTFLIKTKMVYTINQATDTSILAPKFRKEMDEYYEALFEGRKVLGILIRGTDYISTGLSGEHRMATVPQMIPTIHQWLEEDGYDRIFLATEDNDILDQMKSEFGKRIIAVAQERHRVSDFREGQIISELEKETIPPDKLDEMIEDTTINYFYALYLLSRCDSFMCSGQCNGWDVVNDFNGGRFQRSYKFKVVE